MAFIISAAFAYFVVCLWFAVLILASGLHKPACISVNGNKFGHRFPDAFALSWQTFSSTVSVF